MSARMTPAKRFVVRTALVTSTTLATIMGAQALVSIDNNPSFAEQPVVPAQVNVQQPSILPQTGNSNITSAAPNIVILRRSGDQPSTTQNVTPPTSRPVVSAPATQIAPPSPVQIAPPPPAPVTRSSR